MKKTYVTPETELQLLSSEDIMLTSFLDGEVLADGDFALNAKDSWFTGE